MKRLVVLALCALGAGFPLAAPAPVAAQAAEKTAADFDPRALWDGRKIVPFKALDTPKMVQAAQADFMADDEYVLGITLNGESRAYPTRMIWWHHVINDRIGERPYAMSYCSVCNTGIGYDLLVGGKARALDFYGLYYGVVTFQDRETESVFPQVSGEAVKGPLVGTRLRKLPVLDTTWKEWKRLHPNTTVMSPDTEYARFYRPEKRGHDRFPAPFFQPTVTRGDLRLPPFEKVLGVALPQGPGANGPQARRAYPIKAVQEAGGVLNDTVEGQPVAVFLEPGTVTAAAVSRVLEGKTLTFEARKGADGRPLIYDKETGTRWSLEGHGEEGPLSGKNLTSVENHLSQWYGWSAYYPSTGLFGSTEPPKPGNPFAEAGAK